MLCKIGNSEGVGNHFNMAKKKALDMWYPELG